MSAGRLNPKTFSIGRIGPLPSFEVIQVLGPNEMLASIDSSVFKLRGVSTADVADGQSIRPTDFFSVRTTETYDTVAGATKTVYVLELSGRMPEVKPTRVYDWYNTNDKVVITGEFKTNPVLARPRPNIAKLRKPVPALKSIVTHPPKLNAKVARGPAPGAL